MVRAGRHGWHADPRDHGRFLPDRHASKATAAVSGVQVILSTFELEAPLATTPTLIQTVNAVNVRDRRRGEPVPLPTKQAIPA